MTKQLAGYVFDNEAIFLLESDKNNRFENNLDTKAEKSIPEKSNLAPKPITIFVNDISLEETSFLEKIFASVNQPTSNIDIYQIKDLGDTIPDLGKNIFFFGVNPSKINLKISAKLYTIIPFQTQNIIIVDALSNIQKNLNEEKRKLWVLLKSMFN